MARFPDNSDSLLDYDSLDDLLDHDNVERLLHVGISGRHDPSEDMYVAWVDLMGTKQITSRSSAEAAIKTFKFHQAAKWAYEAVGGDDADVEVTPMIDGVYVFCEDQVCLIKYLHNLYGLLAKSAIEEDEHQFVLAIKGAVAYGPVVMGTNVDGIVSLADTDHERLTATGLPLVQAFESEGKAPPFGVYVHESARAFAPDGDEPFNFVWNEWFRSSTDEFDRPDLAADLRERLVEYFDYCEANSRRLDYGEDRIAEHRAQVEEYLPAPDD